MLKEKLPVVKDMPDLNALAEQNLAYLTD